MQRVLVVTAAEPLVTLEEAKQHLRVDGDDEDTLIEGLIAAASAQIDGPAGWLGRSLGEQVLEAGLDAFVYDPIQLPYAPVLSIESIRYEDAVGEWRTLDAAAYELRDDLLGTAWSKEWPRTPAYRGRSRTVLIRYRAGYATLPAAIRVAVLMLTEHLYRNRGSDDVAMPRAVEMLLQPFRVYT